MKTFSAAAWFFVVVAIAAPGAIAAGVGGAGNTGDPSLQFDFARSVAISVLRSTTPKAVLEASGNKELAALYAACRGVMFTGAVRSSFQLVSEIPDGADYQALARRLSDTVIQISRTAMDKLIDARVLTAPFLTAVVLHEVGHDCVLEGKAVDDSYDSQLNQLAEALVRASSQQARSHWIDIYFMDRVRTGDSVNFLELSSRIKKGITQKYLDFIGDWVYQRNREVLGERPAPASDYFANSLNSIFRGWAYVRTELLGAYKEVVVGVLRASIEKDGLFYDNGAGEVTSLPVELVCDVIPYDDKAESTPESIRCVATVSWKPLPDPELSRLRQEIMFDFDIFGTLEFRSLKILD